MTIIIADKLFFYSDSYMLIEHEKFESTTKIKKLPIPINLKSTNENFVINDTIYGYAATGVSSVCDNIINYLIILLEHKQNSIKLHAVDAFFNHLLLFSTIGAINNNNSFNAFLIGKKDNYFLSFNENNCGLEPLNRNKTISSIGCYNKEFKEITEKNKKNCDPIRIIYKAYQDSSSTGGLIDIWQLDLQEKNKSKQFKRIGFCRNLNPKINSSELKKITKNLTIPYSIDFPLNGIDKDIVRF